MSEFAITEVVLKYPKGGGEEGLVAYASIKLCVGGGWFELYVKSMKLMRAKGGGDYFFQMPHEAKKAKCPVCRYRNDDHMPYCNKCGTEVPARVEGWFYDIVVPANIQTRAAILAALVAEHERRTAEDANPVAGQKI